MKKEYASAVRKARAQSRSSTAKDEGAVVAKAAKKRKNDEAEDESSKRTKVSMNVGGISINIEQDSQQSSKKKQAARKTSTEASMKSSKSTDQTTKAKAGSTKKTKDAAERPTTATAGKTKAMTATSTPAKQTEEKPKATPKKSQPKAKAEPNAKAPPKDKPEPGAKAKAKAKAEPKVKAEGKFKAEPKVKKEANAAASPKAKKEFAVKNEPIEIEEQDQDSPRAVTGIYNVYSEQLEEQYEKDADNLRLSLCVDGDTIWGSFQFVSKTGVIRIDGIEANLQMSFGWRSRDEYEGLRFGRGCYGEIGLFGQGQVRGTIFNMFPEPVHFAGRRRPGPPWCGRCADSFRTEWDGFVAEAYGR